MDNLKELKHQAYISKVRLTRTIHIVRQELAVGNMQRNTAIRLICSLGDDLRNLEKKDLLELE